MELERWLTTGKLLLLIFRPALEEVSLKHTSAHTGIPCFWMEGEPCLTLKPSLQAAYLYKGRKQQDCMWWLVCKVSVNVNFGSEWERKERWQGILMKWNGNSAEDFLTDCPHICLWNFQLHTVIMQPNPFTVEEGLSQACPLFCRLWCLNTLGDQEALWGWRINSPPGPRGLQAPPLWQRPRPARPLGGSSLLCRSVRAPPRSLLHVAWSRHREQLWLPAGKSLCFAPSTVCHVQRKPHGNANTFPKVSALPRTQTSMPCWFIHSFDDQIKLSPAPPLFDVRLHPGS